MYYKLTISETGRNSLKEQPALFNTITELFRTKNDINKYIIDRYGKFPGGKNKIYMDTETDVKTIGFLHSYWNQDISHMSKKWFQTDWISISEVVEKPVLINEI